MAVVAPFELDDLLAPRGGARDAHGAHRRLGAGADEAHPLERRHQLRGRARRARLRAGSARRSSSRAARPRRAPSPGRAARGRESAGPTTSRSRCSGCRRRPRAATPAARRMKSGDAADRLERADRAVDAAGENRSERARTACADRVCRIGRRLSRASARGVARVVGDDDVGAGAADGGQRLQHRARARRSSRCAAAAFSIAYSPLTWYAAVG